MNMKFDQLCAVVKSQLERAPQYEVRNDAAELSVAFSRMFEHVFSEVFKAEGVALKYAELFPVSSEVPPEDDLYTYRQIVSNGEAKIMHHLANDLPSVELFGKEFPANVVSIGASYSYGLDHLIKASKLGFALNTEKAMAAKRAIDEKIESLMLSGNTAPAINGFLTAGLGVPSLTTPATKWELATSDNILDNLHSIILSAHNETRGKEQITDIVMGTKEMGIVNTKYQSATFKDDTVKSFFERTTGVKISHWAQLDGSGEVIGYKKSPDVLRAVMPLPFEQMAPVLEGFMFNVNCRAKTGGLMILKPKACAILPNVLTTNLTLAGNTIG